MSYKEKQNLKTKGLVKLINTYDKQIIASAESFKINPFLILSIAKVESGHRANAVRYEKGYKWIKNPAKHAHRHNITKDTEVVLQQMSWGILQIMGATARDLGYNGFIPELLVPEVGVHWGVKYLARLLKKYDKMEDAIASYNAGSVRKNEDGTYENQTYVDKVMKEYNKIKEKYNV